MTSDGRELTPSLDILLRNLGMRADPDTGELELTEERIDELADEAERGYDVSHLHKPKRRRNDR